MNESNIETEEPETFIDQQRRDYYSRFPLGSAGFIDAWAQRFSGHDLIIDRDLYAQTDRRILQQAWQESGPSSVPAPAVSIPSFREGN